jgi:YEATS family
MSTEFNIEVKDTVFDPNLPAETPRKVHVRKGDDGRSLYKVWLYLSGYDLPYVQNVFYQLHPTFSDRVRRVRRSVSNPNCQLVIWTWGLFKVKVTIEDKSNRRYEVEHDLSYDKELRQEGIQYVYEEDNLRSVPQPQA